MKQYKVAAAIIMHKNEILAGFGKKLMSNRHTCPECGGRLMKKSGS